MKIAMTLLSGVGYGGLTYFNNLVPALAAADQENEYHLFVPMAHPLVRETRQKNFIFHERIGNNRSAIKRLLWEQLVLPRELKKYKIDILFTAKNLNVFLARCKTVISIRNMEPLVYRVYDNDWKLSILLWLKWQLTKWSVHKASQVVAVSQAVKDRLIEKFPDVGKKVSVVYNGNPVSQAVETADKSVSAILLPFLLTASKFVAYANQLNLLKGYALLVEKNPDMPPLWFVGGVHDKKYFQKVQKFVSDKQLENRVKFLGLVAHDQLLKLMRKAQAFVFPSTLEACPHTLIEAMACGVPIATSNTPPMPEICADAAIYFDPHNSDDIAKKMQSVMSDRALRERLAQDGPKRSQLFTWENTAKSLIKIFML